MNQKYLLSFILGIYNLNIYKNILKSFLKYKYISRYGSKNGTQLYTDDTKGLQNSNFDPSRQTKFITHGWKSSAMSTNIANLKDGIIIIKI